MANERLRRAILDAGLSATDVAAQVGTDAKTVERWIANGRIPHPRNPVAASRATGVDQLVLWPEFADARARAVAGSEVLQVFRIAERFRQARGTNC
jgi:transcriptional regulator with XRE-family HTH domain